MLELNQDVDEADKDRFKYAPLEYACLVGCKKRSIRRHAPKIQVFEASTAIRCHVVPLSKSYRDWFNEEDLVRELLAASLDPEIANSIGTALLRATERGLGQVAQALIGADANENAVHKDGWNAAHLAAKAERMHILEILATADVRWNDLANLNNSGGSTYHGMNVLHVAASSSKSNIIGYFIETKNFDINAKSTRDLVR